LKGIIRRWEMKVRIKKTYGGQISAELLMDGQIVCFAYGDLVTVYEYIDGKSVNLKRGGEIIAVFWAKEVEIVSGEKCVEWVDDRYITSDLRRP
jgi:hypothetical protein